MRHWIEELRMRAPPHPLLALCDNKCDLIDERQVRLEELRTFATEHLIENHKQTTAKEETGINEIFLEIAQRINKRKENLVSSFLPLNFSLDKYLNQARLS